MSIVLMSIRINTRSMDEISWETIENHQGGWKLGRAKEGDCYRTETSHRVGFVE